ncbi:MAG: TraR/DksA family transcriptional regulator, partial [Candidatus Kryptonium sp.]
MAKKKSKSGKKKITAKKTVKKSSKRATKASAKSKTKKVEQEKIKTANVTTATASPHPVKNDNEAIKKTENQPQKTSYSKEELNYFKQILLKKREEILEMLESHRQSLVESATQNDKPLGTPYSIHMEYGTETEEREKTMFFIAREEKMLNYIDAALMRIERGTYGVCISCGKLID